ncbi:hypothetical protein S83_038802, partial [Arachis hypogaea]
ENRTIQLKRALMFANQLLLLQRMEFLNSKKGIEKGQGSNSLKFECCLRRYCLFSEGYKVALLLYPHHWETHSEGNRAGPIWIQVWHCSSLLTSAFLTNENYDSDVRDDTETFLNRIVPECSSAPWKHALEEHEAHVSDFGTAKFLKPGSYSWTTIAGTFGYAAPGTKCTQEHL